MKALILAGGAGKRLMPLTKDKPKCLVEVDGKPIIEYQIDAIMANGIRDFVIVIGYKGEKIKEFIKSKKKYQKLNVKYIENKDYESTSSAYGFWLARNEIKDETYLHFNCDIIFFAPLVKKLIESKYDNVIVIDKKAELGEHIEQVILDGDKIIKMDSMPYEGAMAKAEGIAKFSPNNIKVELKEIERLIKKGELKYSCFKIKRKILHEADYYALDAGDNLLAGINDIEQLKIAEKIVKNYVKSER